MIAEPTGVRTVDALEVTADATEQRPGGEDDAVVVAAVVAAAVVAASGGALAHIDPRSRPRSSRTRREFNRSRERSLGARWVARGD